MPMSLDDEELNFGVTLDNGDQGVAEQTARKMVTQSKNKVGNTGQSSQFNQFGIGKDDYDLQRAGHPTICLMTILFKSLAFFMYFFIGMFISRVLTFIFVIILGCLDFWVVKNISGRLLVGLRWWSTYDEKGNQIWKFQTHSKQFVANPVDKTFFWSGQIVGTLVWGVFLFINVLGFDLFDSLLLTINFIFCGTNLYGYYRCNNEYSKKLGDLKKKIGQKGLMTLANRFM